MNLPYVKEYDKDGIVTNPINGSYEHKFQNRSDRKKLLKKVRFYGESKNYHLTVTKISRHRRFKQIINCIDPKTKKLTGERRVIEHYIDKHLTKN